MEIFLEISGVPTNSCILFDTPQAAKAWPRGDIRLGFCPECGFVSNTAFDPRLTEYSGRYEETQAFSPTFNEFHERLARDIVERHELRDKDIIEIGCGKGEFLNLLCELGQNRGLGYDPGYSESRGKALGSGRFEVIRDFFSESYTDRSADFVCCKMTLEHIPTPNDFLGTATRVTRQPDGLVFIQVPESKRILADVAFEDIYYEHCSYFTAGSLSRLFSQLGFAVRNIDITYGDQYLAVEAAPTANEDSAGLAAADDLAELAGLVATFPARFAARIEEWRDKFAGWRADGQKVVLWGSGSKAVAFLAAVPGSDHVAHAVDINPFRQGCFMPGTGQRILSPEELLGFRPDVVIVMNRVYVPEIQRDLERLGLQPQLHAL
ncbi:class I SAM-dependent methyltransferase [Thioalkalivibrio sp. XN8]|uniref:class I SAM-dependent methyltransferase n=1 Tax=Thioalkalivibrio sp. XN8 TaxID=2712863 RepID=UPI0019824CE6|nr:class I SAM-dependent methyltransferase [Thioalkalivibrio sp. XN8]